MPTNPTNLSAATAIDVSSLPYSQTFKSTILAGANPHLWFSYTPVATDVVLGVWPFTSLASANKPRLSVWFGTAVSLTDLTTLVDLSNTANVPYSVPMAAGTSTTYFFEVINAGVDIAGVADLSFSALTQPALTVAVGDIMVNDDTFGFPVVALDPTTGAVKQPFIFSAGESADIQPDGTVLAEAIDFGASAIGLQLWDKDFALLQTIAYPSNFHGLVFHIWSSALGGWFVSARGADTTHTTVTKVFTDGTFGQTWTVTHASVVATTPIGIACSPDETILYYAITRTANVPIQRWDLVNDVALTDLTAGIANYQVRQDILVLADGTVVVDHVKITVTRDANVHHYAADGTLLHTYAFGVTDLNRMCRALDDPTSFWVWIYPLTGGGTNDGSNRYVNIVVADGSFAADFTVSQYEHGLYATTPTATPTARFGPSFSCPMWIYPVEVIPPVEPVTTLIRRERIFRHLSDEQQWIFYQWLQIDAEAGVGLSEGQGSDPQIILQWSDDGGHTWSNEHLLSAGRQGEYGKRAILKQPLGRSRDRVFKVAMSDPVRWALLNAYFGAEKGSS